MVRVQVARCMAWLDYDEHADSLSTMDNKVGVTSPESTTQTLPSFEEYTPPVTYPKEVEKTLGTLIEVEPLNETKLKKEMFDDDWGLESKEVFPLGEELSLFDRLNEVERGRILEAHLLKSILQQEISQCMAPSHHNATTAVAIHDTTAVTTATPPTPPLPHHTTPLPPPPRPVTIIVAYTTTHRRCHSTPTTAATPLPYPTAAAVLLLGVFVWRLHTKLGVFVLVAATARKGAVVQQQGGCRTAATIRVFVWSGRQQGRGGSVWVSVYCSQQQGGGGVRLVSSNRGVFVWLLLHHEGAFGFGSAANKGCLFRGTAATIRGVWNCEFQLG
nr:hypothetical protein [Tanacetum cinerariifolium]